MPLCLYNSLKQKKEEFISLHPQRVGMYVCGVTVYDYCHLGHARASVVFDMIYRYLTHQGYTVTYVRNFTDIDDKIIKKSQSTQTPWQQITAQFIQAFHEDMTSLGNLAPTVEPKATDFIPHMVQMIQTLMDKGHAYQAGGDVYYAVRSKKDYGKLSHKNLEELESGARIEIGEQKKDPLDFALWKAAKPGEPTWPSPFGPGRPGWHIECSVMRTQLLGEQVYIHGGGRDLIFPHHENEIAQSEGTTGKEFVRYWIHNGFVNLNTEKMSKSTGNILTIREVLKKCPREVIRYFLLSSHYSSPLDYTEQNLTQAKTSVERIYECKRLAESQLQQVSKQELKDPVLDKIQNLKTNFETAMNDDFNSAMALGNLFEVVREVFRLLNDGKDKALQVAAALAFLSQLQIYDKVLGLFGTKAEDYFKEWQALKADTAAISEAEILSFIQQREIARKNKDWKLADQIRDQLQEKGVLIKDNPTGTEWRFK